MSYVQFFWKTSFLLYILFTFYEDFDYLPIFVKFSFLMKIFSKAPFSLCTTNFPKVTVS